MARITLQPSEGIILRAAATIYAAYVGAGRVAEGKEKDWRSRAVNEAISLAQTVEDLVQSDSELS
jgi:hypothetical protein